MFQDEILKDIDATLEQLITNSEILARSDIGELSELEIDAFRKTQESLLHHWMRMDQTLALARRKAARPEGQPAMHRIRQKTERFKLLEQSIRRQIRKTQKTHSLLIKRRCKKLLRKTAV